MKKLKPPTAKQIEAEIDWLEENKEKVPHHTMFGDDNWERIEAEVAVLKGEKTEEDFQGEDDEEYEQLMDIRMHVTSAEEWMRGASKESPASGWKDLLKAKAKKAKKAKK